jgi:hypothetical protein
MTDDRQKRMRKLECGMRKDREKGEDHSATHGVKADIKECGSRKDREKDKEHSISAVAGKFFLVKAEKN